MMQRRIKAEITMRATFPEHRATRTIWHAPSVQQMRGLARSKEYSSSGVADNVGVGRPEQALANAEDHHELTHPQLMRMNEVNCVNLTANIQPPRRLLKWSTVQVGKICRALASPSRRQILNHLRMGPNYVSQIASAMEMISRPAVSQHLRILLKANLVTYETLGGRTFYRLAPRGLENLRNYMDALGAVTNARSAEGLRKT